MGLRSLFLAFAVLLLPTAVSSSAARPAPPVRWVNVIVGTPEGGVRQGNPNAKVKLVEYGSRGCPYCQHFAAEGVAAMRAKYIATGKLSYEYREFWVHPYDPGLSLIGRCVPTASFFAVLDEMYARQQELVGHANEQMEQAIAKLPRTQQPGAWARRLGYVALLTRRGIPLARVNQCLANVTLLNKLLAEVKAGAQRGVMGTPTFFLNGAKVVDGNGNGIGTWADLEPELIKRGA